MRIVRRRQAPRLRRVAFRTLVGLILLFVVAPLLFVVWVAFFSNKIVSFPPEGYTVHWFANAWAVEVFREGFVLSAEIGLLSMLGGLVLGIPAALAIVRYEFRGRQLANMILSLPIIVPGVVAGSAMYVFYIEFEILTDIQLASTLPGLVIAHILLTIPWTLRLVSASLVGIPPALEEAAMNLGAGPWVTFWRVTLPVIKPGIVAAALFNFIISFGDLEKSLFLVGPGRTTLPIAIVNYLEWSLDPTILCVATLQILTIGTALVVSSRYVNLTRAF